MGVDVFAVNEIALASMVRPYAPLLHLSHRPSPGAKASDRAILPLDVRHIPKQLTRLFLPSLHLPPWTRQAGVVYEARVLEVKGGPATGAPPGAGGTATQYRVHYQGWNKKWDEVRRCRFTLSNPS